MPIECPLFLENLVALRALERIPSRVISSVIGDFSGVFPCRPYFIFDNNPAIYMISSPCRRPHIWNGLLELAHSLSTRSTQSQPTRLQKTNWKKSIPSTSSTTSPLHCAALLCFARSRNISNSSPHSLHEYGTLSVELAALSPPGIVTLPLALILEAE